MLHNAMNWLRRLFGAEPRKPKSDATALTAPSASTENEATVLMEEHIGTIVPYDEHLLERARTQWQFGDWQSLAAIGRDNLEHHPDRAKLVLLVAVGRLQIGASDEARQLLQLAQDWGCSRRLIAQTLISGTYNSLGRAAIAGHQENRALSHFSQAVALGAPGSDTKLLTQARVMTQCKNMEQSVPEQIKKLFH